MSPSLHSLMEAGRLPPLAHYFAAFIARGCGAGDDSIVALSAALVSARNLEGDVCVDLAAHAGRPLFSEEEGAAADGPCAPALTDWLAALRDCPWVGAPGEQAPLILECGVGGGGGGSDDGRAEGCRLYLGKYWHFEAAVAAALLGRMRPAADLDPTRLADGLERLFPPAETTAAAAPDWQRIAAAVAVTRRFAVISGGPGTGKTTTVVKVLALLLEQDPELRIALAAPTGKAAARLTESIGAGKQRIAAAGGTAADALTRIPESAQTIHRLLGYGADGLFRRDADNQLPVDCLVVDEASMIDLPLMARLLAALPAAARLVLLGDRDQLASVEAGNVLGDITGRGQPIGYGPAQRDLLARVGAAPAALLASAAGPGAAGGAAYANPPEAAPAPAAAVALLRRSWRFGADSGIGALARAVNAGDGGTALALLDDAAHADVVRLLPPADGLHPSCIDWAVERFAPVLDADGPEAALAVLERARVLAALHRGPYGVETLNARIAERLQAKRPATAAAIARDGLHHGMPVMITANDYEVGLYNGDVGVLWADDAGPQEPEAPSAVAAARGSGIPDVISTVRYSGDHRDPEVASTAASAAASGFGSRADTSGAAAPQNAVTLQPRIGRLRAHFRAADGSLRTLSVRQLPPYVCAYALTVHKSQGSEFDEVLLVLPSEPHPLATRELLYTGVTRARKQVTVHAGAAALRQACATRVQRASALAERLGWAVMNGAEQE